MANGDNNNKPITWGHAAIILAILSVGGPVVWFQASQNAKIDNTASSFAEFKAESRNSTSAAIADLKKSTSDSLQRISDIVATIPDQLGRLARAERDIADLRQSNLEQDKRISALEREADDHEQRIRRQEAPAPVRNTRP